MRSLRCPFNMRCPFGRHKVDKLGSKQGVGGSMLHRVMGPLYCFHGHESIIGGCGESIKLVDRVE
eukprot:CAMPEP_0173382414 /NCGR_PEP_ID=MMETSP1356-20130122/4920_1 /TAXON_ID=77927 ORGANISM="Hemiselmis virescens, Strain PCC157" /NCGR_SAMPLE_ID=MMETSP1356 /ASSEMBLY_ACC=CAM_ASM_000847 /LENGTH=64 /DNA_ID=CAMNT_0014336739 /DNA_START=46 /DNA_END=237 /DNA_ORIENTATION=+